MKLKNWLVATAITILPKTAAAEVSAPNTNTTNTTKVEVVTTTPNHANATKADSVPATDITVPSNDSVRADTLTVAPQDSVLSESELYEKRLELLRESKKDMLLLIAHFEDITPKAKWDNVAKQYSVGLGFTRKKDGSKVTANTVIRSEAELLEYWDLFTEEHMFPTMAKYLKIEKTNHNERVSLGSTAFNCGAGIYKKPKENSPSNYAEILNTFFETGDTIYLNKAVYLLEQRCKSRGAVVGALLKRRQVESAILCNKIHLINSDTIAPQGPNDSVIIPENSIDLSKIIIGASYSIGALPKDGTELATKLREFDACGYNVTDSLRRAFAPIIPVKRRQKKAPAKQPARRGGR